jgi:tetrahydromethanopterin S-methyltransferase subunit B
MTYVAVVATVLLAVIAAGFAAGAALFLLKSRPGTRKPRSNEALPRAAVLLALKGTDEYLQDCLRSLLRQDYPDYVVHIVVDSKEDPAWGIVTRVLEEEDFLHVRVATLRDPLFTCSLKCSALLQMLEEVDPGAEVLALIDGDVVPHPAWLRQLAAPLADSAVGASFGIPWYFPLQQDWPAMVRKVCWTPGAVLMLLCGWIWGGSAALPSRIFRDPALVERWSRSVSSDASLRDVINAHGLRLEWAPALVMPNYESVRFEALVNQLARSLATSRLYLNRWPLTLMAVSLAAGSLLAAVVACVVSLITTNVTALTVSAAALGSYLLILMGLLLVVDRRALSVTRSNGASVPPLTLAAVGKMFVSLALAHGLYLLSAVKAQFVRSLTWRGVRYAINGKLDVRRVAPARVVAPQPLADRVYSVKQAGGGVEPALLSPYSSAFARLQRTAIRKEDVPSEGADRRIVQRAAHNRESVDSDSW